MRLGLELKRRPGVLTGRAREMTVSANQGFAGLIGLEPQPKAVKDI